MTREDALEKLTHPAYDPETIMQDFEYIATKLRDFCRMNYNHIWMLLIKLIKIINHKKISII